MQTARRFALGVQLTLPKDFRRSEAFAGILTLAMERGLAELELNIVDPDQLDPQALAGCLRDFGLSMTRLALGAYAKACCLSLSSANDGARRKSFCHCVGISGLMGSILVRIKGKMIYLDHCGSDDQALGEIYKEPHDSSRILDDGPGGSPVMFQVGRWIFPVSGSQKKSRISVVGASGCSN